MPATAKNRVKSLAKSSVKSLTKPPRTAAWLKAEEQKSLLRLITCGSVDDGKSTLIGRLLYESQLLMEDQLAELKRDSARRGAGALDFSLLVDGLAA
ncbi:MAG: adenylyl-sulfate kinase, partial [Hyphomicrobiales bacterium]|nr:adenylyl-sulfate kinase [Hyphomicrobiales bacterium]